MSTVKSDQTKCGATICALPWISASLRNNGDFRVCCQANVSEGSGILRKTNGESFNWSRDTLESARNSSLLKDIRSFMLEGRWHPTCERCRSEEAAGVNSRRVRVNALYKDDFSPEAATDGTGVDGLINTKNFPVLDLDVRFGNLCNLRCRMCGPTDSSSWYGDYLKINGPFFQSSNGRVEIVSDQGALKAPSAGFEWYENEHVGQELEALAPSVRRLYIVGGEPFLIQRHWDYLDQIVQMGRAGEVDLEYNTNLTRIPESAWELWRHFKSVRLGVSIEGVGTVNDFIRYPSRFAQIERNLERIDSAEGNLWGWLAVTVSIYNVLHLPDLILWKIRKGFKRINRDPSNPLLTSHPLHKPEFLNIKALPPWAKEIVVQRYRAFPAILERELTSLGMSEEVRVSLLAHTEKLLGSYVKFMMSGDLTEWLPEFVRHVQKLDAVRGQNFATIVPEFAGLVDPAPVAQGSVERINS